MKTLASAFLLLLAFLLLQSCNVGSEDSKKENRNVYNGVRKNYRKNGTLLSTVTYKDSLRDGPAYNYYDNGKVQAEFMYQKGVKHGEEKIYYENGNIYQVTPYKDGAKSGVKKMYYEGNMLMAEIPFDNGHVIPGLKEYTKSGKLKNNRSKIKFELVDKTAFENKFDLLIRLSDGSKVVKFGRYFVTNDGDYIGERPINTKKGLGTLTFYLAPGNTLMDKVYVRATRKTSLGNVEIINGTYNLALVNKKQFN